MDRRTNTRKIGVEITEDKMGEKSLGMGGPPDTISGLIPKQEWATVGPEEREDIWLGTLKLPNRDGNPITWYIAPCAKILPFFTEDKGKVKLMRWGKVILTEDTGEFEWIIQHPDEPQALIYYQDRLAEVQKCRTIFRGALNEILSLIGIVDKQCVIAMNRDPKKGEVFHMCLGATNKASGQITVECTDPSITKRALIEGLTQGLRKKERAKFAESGMFMGSDPDIVKTVAASAKRVTFSEATQKANTELATIDMELIIAYIIGDCSHKIATLITGPQWGEDQYASFKNWRLFFPKSHPSQIVLQALKQPPKSNTWPLLQFALMEQKFGILDDVINLFVTKLVKNTVSFEWQEEKDVEQKKEKCKPGDNLLLAIANPVGTGGDFKTLKTELLGYINCRDSNFLYTEFDNIVKALVDMGTPPTAVNVVRSTGFAVHPPGTTGFAFEDRLEVPTTFPDLSTAYERIVAICKNY